MFRAEAPSQYIPSKSQSLKPEVISDVGAGDQIRIRLPSFLNFVDPRSTFFKCAVQITGGRGTIVPEPDAGGIHALFRNVLLRSGDGATLENIEDYNVLQASLKPFGAQSTLKHKQGLFEGQQSIPTTDNSLYYAKAPTITASSPTTPDTEERSRNTPQIYAKLETGLFSGDQIIPMNLLGGMSILIDTEDADRALRLLSLDGCLRTAGSVYGTPITMSGDKAVGADARVSATAGNDKNWFSVLTSIDSTAENPWVINDLLYVSGSAIPSTDEEQLGLIIGFYYSGGKLGVTYVPQRNATIGLAIQHLAAASVLYAKTGDRVGSGTFLGKDDLGAVGTGTVKLVAPTYTLSDIEILAETVTPPEQYSAGMLKKAMSSEGVSMDILTSELHRFNQVSSQGVTQVQIPTLAKRAKSIICAPLQQDNHRNMTQNSLNGISGAAVNYQFQFGNELVPNRRVSLSRYGLSPALAEPLHVTELQKSLINIGKPVFSLQNIEDHFIISRALSRYGQVADLSDETVSLRVEYGASAKQKVFQNYIFKLARITIASGIVRVES